VLDKVSDPGVAAALMQGELALGGERRRACVLFCDIRGFTPLTQDMDPQEVIQLLNEHFTPLAKIIALHHGVVDKYVGDLVMAVFGAPVGHASDVEDAMACALAMMDTRRTLNENNPRPIRIGIGLAAGDMVAGCMGSADRLNYTVLGERVNLAARLCSRAASMEILADAETVAMAGPRVRAESIGSIELKGFSQAIGAYRILDIQAP
jgi:class 3 adenylate cyclase